MTTSLAFSEIINENFSLLKKYTPLLVRVHGRQHPELAVVKDVFASMNVKVLENDINEVDLSSEFTKLRRVTNNYAIPSDACGTYIVTYEMLQSADEAYHSNE